jgi:hypothetical protein
MAYISYPRYCHHYQFSVVTSPAYYFYKEKEIAQPPIFVQQKGKRLCLFESGTDF